MKGHRIKSILGAGIFILLGIFLYGKVNTVFLEKNSYWKYRNYRDQDRVDVLILGNSHADNGIDPEALSQRLSEAAGRPVNVFNYSIYGMRIEQMYYFVREIMKIHKPELAVIETFAFVPVADEDREILARRAFDVFPLSRNKIEAVRYCVKEDRASYYFPILKYHSRWKELKAKDVEALYKRELWEKSGVTLNREEDVMEEQDDYFLRDLSALTASRPLNETQTECFEALLDLFGQKDIPVLLTSIPFRFQLGYNSMDMMETNRYLEETYCTETGSIYGPGPHTDAEGEAARTVPEGGPAPAGSAGEAARTDSAGNPAQTGSAGEMAQADSAGGPAVRMLDMNLYLEQMQFGYADLYNEGHCNTSGAEKVTGLLGDALTQWYDL